MKVVEVTWRDSKRYLYQMDDRDKLTVTIIKTVGYVHTESKDFVALFQDSIEGDYRGVITIPRENIVKLRVLVR